MARLIDADALKKDWHMGLGSCNDCQQDTRRCQLDVDFTRMDICGMIDDAPTVGGWISVKDRLPEDYTKVLVPMTDVAGTFFAVVWREANNWNDGKGGWPNEDVTHWMPLPEPPKEDD